MSLLRATGVDNGRRFQVDCPQLYTGQVGGRLDKRGGEFACVGRLPQRPVTTGTVNDRSVRLLAIRKSGDVDGMLVVRFEFTGDDA